MRIRLLHVGLGRVEDGVGPRALGPLEITGVDALPNSTSTVRS